MTHDNVFFGIGYPVPPVVVRPQDRICAICSASVPINGTRPNQAIVQLNCGHFFCYLCIRRWGVINRRNTPKCPRCLVHLGQIVFLEFYGARCLSDDPRFGFRYACARAKHFHELGLHENVIWEGSRRIALGHAEMYVATLVYVLLVKVGDTPDILDTNTRWKILHALFMRIAEQTTEAPTMDELHDHLWYGVYTMFTFPMCLCAI